MNIDTVKPCGVLTNLRSITSLETAIFKKVEGTSHLVARWHVSNAAPAAAERYRCNWPDLCVASATARLLFRTRLRKQPSLTVVHRSQTELRNASDDTATFVLYLMGREPTVDVLHSPLNSSWIRFSERKHGRTPSIFRSDHRGVERR